MKISEAFPSKYLSAKELGGKAVKVTIERVDMESIGSGDDQDHKPVVYFHNKKKGLVLNKTNANVIADAYGDDTTGWIGQELEVRSEKVTYKGNLVDGLRVQIAQESVPAEAIPF